MFSDGYGPNTAMKRAYGPVADGDESAAKDAVYEYDGAGNVTEARVAAGGTVLVSSFQYDGRGNVVIARTPERGETRTMYDVGGRPLKQWLTGRDGEITYGWDAANRPVSVAAAGDFSQNYTIAYLPGVGQADYEEGSRDGTVYRRDYEYDGDTRQLRQITETYWLSSGRPPLIFTTEFAYDGYGEAERVSYNNEFDVVYSRDALGRIESVRREAAAPVDGKTVVADETHYPDGSAARTVYGNNLMNDYYKMYGAGVPTLFMVLDLDLIAGDSVPDRSTFNGLYSNWIELSGRWLWRERYLVKPVTSAKYLMENFYNPSQLVFGKAGHNFQVGAEYDREGRITATDYRWGDTAPPFAQYDYQYDRAGNRTAMEVAERVAGATVTDDYHYYYSSLNRLELEDRAGAFRDYDYDEQGNMTSNPEHEYSYDHFGRLVQVDRGAIKFIYSLSGDKLLKIGPGNIVTAYFYGGGSEVLYETEYRDTGASLEPLGSDYYLYSDTGLVAQFSGTPSGAPGFVSRFFDSDVGLYQLGARWYDPTLGRFVSPDPIQSSLNQYAYAGNNPFRYQDASGLQMGAVSWCIDESGQNRNYPGCSDASSGYINMLSILPEFPEPDFSPLTKEFGWHQGFRAHLEAADEESRAYAEATRSSLSEGDYVGAAQTFGQGFPVGLYADWLHAINMLVPGSNLEAAVLLAPMSGRRGGLSHRARVADIQNKLEAKNWVVLTGGSQKERIVEMAWRKLGRYPDLTLKRGAKTIAVQIGRREKIIRPGFTYRLPIARERAAIDDLTQLKEFDAVYFFER